MTTKQNNQAGVDSLPDFPLKHLKHAFYKPPHKHYIIIAPKEIVQVGDFVLLMDPSTNNPQATVKVIDGMGQADFACLYAFGHNFKTCESAMLKRYPASEIRLFACEVMDEV